MAGSFKRIAATRATASRAKTIVKRARAVEVVRDGLTIAKAARSPRAVRRELARKEEQGND